MKVSIITAVYNRVTTVAEAIESVQSQTYQDIEHVLIDGSSTDGTLGVLESMRDDRSVLVSEPDKGIYDALSKGMARATGEVIGLMHSDDTFASNNVVQEVAKAFEDPTVDAVYGDLDYVAQNDPSKIIRRWKAGEFTAAKLKRGWMPPHPTLYLRRSVIDRFGGYDTSYRIAADYDAILRYFGRGNLKVAYIPTVLVKMRVGGESNQSIKKIVRKSREDYRALRSNEVGGVTALAWKNLSKLNQFIAR
ncbi:MAG: glycosyltransferase family 2 protein [Planctomycetota bacterium]